MVSSVSGGGVCQLRKCLNASPLLLMVLTVECVCSAGASDRYEVRSGKVCHRVDHCHRNIQSLDAHLTFQKAS